MIPTLLSIGPVSVYSYGLFLAIGLLVGVYYAWKRGVTSGITDERILDICFLAIIGGLIGSRIWYVASNWNFFVDDPVVALQFWNGGLSYFGALLGGLVTLLVLALRFKISYGQLADIVAPATAVGSIIGQLGAFLGGVAYGAQTSFFWGVPMQGLAGLRNPSQLLEAVLQLGILLFLLRIRKRVPFAGFLVLSYLLLYALGRFGLEFLRGDQTRGLGPFSQAHLASLLLGVVALMLIYLKLARLRGSWHIDFGKLVRMVS